VISDPQILRRRLNSIRLEPTGSAVPVAVRVATEPTGVGQFACASASLVHVAGAVGESGRALLIVTTDGAPRALRVPPRAFEEPRLSPDGSRIAVGIRGTTSDIWICDIARGTLMRQTFYADNFAPVWTPDGQRLTFSSNRQGPANIFWGPSDDLTAAEPLIVSPFDQVPGSWSPDGTTVLFTEYHPKTGADLWLLSLGGDRTPRSILRTPFNEFGPALSPNGSWMAYASDETGRFEVYVMAFPGPGPRWQISTGGGTEPIWSREGDALFYRCGTRLMSTAVETEGSFHAGNPCMLFEGRYQEGAMTGLPNYDVGPGAGEFLMVGETLPRETPWELIVTLEGFVDLGEQSA